MNERLIRMPEVQNLTGMGRTTIYTAMERYGFPKPIKLGARSVAWRPSDIAAWIETRVSELPERAA